MSEAAWMAHGTSWFCEITHAAHGSIRIDWPMAHIM